MATKGLLCIHKQRPAGGTNSLGPKARLRWLEAEAPAPRESAKALVSTMRMGAGAQGSLKSERVPETTALEDKGLRRAESVLPPHSFQLSAMPPT